MKPPKCCKQFMDFKIAVTRISQWELFFQCKKCGEIIVNCIDSYYDGEYNTKLKEGN